VSKDVLKKMRVINQVDTKFILAKEGDMLYASSSSPLCSPTDSQRPTTVISWTSTRSTRGSVLRSSSPRLGGAMVNQRM
jgi:DNA mismatch repair ATPase MutL